ncbi:MAG: dihydroorotate dehydrogenase electron transfer subunit [Firmicutes bacterium]|nr:dihydroorotate dehydrogenase electron transfer subunit [Bacillota bacterium]
MEYIIYHTKEFHSLFDESEIKTIKERLGLKKTLTKKIMKKQIEFSVDSIKPLNSGVIELKLVSKEQLPEIKGGQFLMLYLNDNSKILNRPFVIYKWDSNSITLGIAIVGKGTEQITKLKKGDKVSALLPLGNGWEIGLKPHHKKVAIIGSSIGGVAVHPILLSFPNKECHTFLGFKDKQNIMFEKEFKKTNLKISTVDGSYGFKGYVNEMFEDALNSGFKPDVILACGSHLTLQLVKDIAIRRGIECFMSGEERMACGIGACLVCTCKIQKDEGGEIQHQRVCADGPVFNIREVVL